MHWWYNVGYHQNVSVKKEKNHTILGYRTPSRGAIYTMEVNVNINIKIFNMSIVWALEVHNMHVNMILV